MRTDVINPIQEANDRQQEREYEFAKGIRRLGLENSRSSSEQPRC